MEIRDGDLTYRIIGCAMSVHSGLGPGLREHPYENAFAIELEVQGLSFTQQPRYPIFYRDQLVGNCQPDFVIRDEVVVDCKAVATLGESETGQMLNYLRITKLSVGLLLNFRGMRLEQKRVQL